MVETRPERILRTLRETLTVPQWTTSSKDPFRTLIVTIISQNTAGRNTAKAFENLSKRFKIAPEVLAKAQTDEIERCLKVAGLHRQKAKTIKQVSRIILDRFHGGLGAILSLPLEDARRTLLELPGVGPKTADVVLLFCAQKPTVPVDTHVFRVSKRLGLAPADGDYEGVRASLQGYYSQEDYLEVHVLLIAHGRRYCRARAPSCTECPLGNVCPSKHAWDSSD
jgi:endonuclease-3